ncbi:MAG: GNAT family N-acetyltransferase [Bacteroidota bacterium]
MDSNQLELRNFDLKDCKKLFSIYSDGEAMKYRGTKPMKSVEDAQAFVEKQVVENNTETIIRKAVILKASDELIGSIMMRHPKQFPEICEIGYSIGFDYWGKGIGKAVVNLILKTLEDSEHIKQINAWSHRDNTASIKILRSFGFEQKNQDKSAAHLLFIKILK